MNHEKIIIVLLVVVMILAVFVGVTVLQPMFSKEPCCLKISDRTLYEGDEFYVNKDDVWTVTESPYKYYDFIYPDIVANILGEAYFYSEENLDNSINYTLKISSNTMNKIFYDKDTDFDEVPNTIIVNSTDKIINSVIYNLDSFCKLNKICNNSMKVTTTFDMYGDVKKIDNPIK